MVGLVSGASVLLAGVSGDGLALIITWLEAGPSALPAPLRNKVMAMLGPSGRDPPAATSAVVAPGPAESTWGNRDPVECRKGPGEGPPGLSEAA